MRKTIGTNTGRSAEYKALSVLTQDTLFIVTVDMVNGRCVFNRIDREVEEVLKEYIIQGFTFDDIAADYIPRRCHPEDVERLKDLFNLDELRERLGKSDFISVRARRKNGAYIRAEVKKNGDSSFVLAVRDVDAEVRGENESFEKLQDSYRRALNEIASKKKYIYNISHDIRTPLNAILGYSTVAGDNVSDPKLLKKCLRKIDDAGQQVLGIINEILDLNELEEGTIRVSEVITTMADLERQVEESVSPQMKDRKLDFSIRNLDSINPSLVADNNHMVRMLVNLVRYSCKHTEAGGSITLTIKPVASPEAGRRNYAYIIEDNGIGMEPDRLKAVRAFIDDDPNPVEDDIDISIAIVKNILKAIGGVFTVDSIAGKGTTFTVTTSFEISDDEIEKQTRADISEEQIDVEKNTILTGKRILVVDDSQVSCEIATTILNGFSAETECASDGMTAIDMIVANEVGYYDLVLMDIEMPNIDGFEATRQIRGLHRPDARTIPVVAFTGVVFEDTRKSAEAAGMNGFITKPINASEMRNTLIEVLENQRKD